MFKDTKEGQTHYVGDGCNPPHPPLEKTKTNNRCTCIEHKNGDEKVLVVNDCPIHDELYGKNSLITEIKENQKSMNNGLVFHNTISKLNNEWEEELVEKFASTEGIEMLVARTESIKSFIHSLLSLERQKLRKLIMNSELDTEAHSRGRCSFPLMSICSAEECRIKMELLKLLE